jgi:hypothetical protein
MPDIGPLPEPLKSTEVDFSKHWSILDQTKAELKKSGRSGVVITVEPDDVYRSRLEGFLAKFNTPVTNWNMSKPYLVIEHATQAKELFQAVVAAGLKAELVEAGA